MSFRFVICACFFSVTTHATRRPVNHEDVSCPRRLAPVDAGEDLFEVIEGLRAAGPPGRAPLEHFVAHADVLAVLPDAARRRFVDLLLDDRGDLPPARALLDRVLRGRRSAAAKAGPPGLDSVAALERHFDPRRVVQLRLIADLVDRVREGSKTSSIRRGNRWDLKRGPAVFRVPRSGVKIPVELTSVEFGRRLTSLKASDLRAQGPFVARILDEIGEGAAIAAVYEGMAQYYPGFGLGDDVTVIRFRRR